MKFHLTPLLLIGLLFLVTGEITSQPAQKVPEQWITYFEKSGFLHTPRYNEIIAWLNSLAKTTGLMKPVVFGKTPQGRDMVAYLISKDRNFNPPRKDARKKPFLFITAGIHSGEIEGKDAGLILLREMLITKEKAALLNSADVLFVPVFNIDGHERFGKYNRINQNGPEEMGWRTTAQNLNLNRDWLKADAPEMQALLKLINDYNPDFYIDSHTTDGADFQYSINYGVDYGPNFDTALARRVEKSLIPFMERTVTEKGFLIAPYLDFRGDTPTKGLVNWVTPPRFSTGYAVLRNRISILIETHMLKPYKERVFATKAMFEMALEYLAANGTKLLQDNREADARSAQAFENKKYIPFNFAGTDSQTTFLYKGIRFKKDSSVISGGERITYTGEPYDVFIPYYAHSKAIDSVAVPYAYAVPQEYGFLIDRLKVHGISVTQLQQQKVVSAGGYTFKDVKFNKSPYEGRFPVTFAFDYSRRTDTLPAGTYIIKTNQALMRIIINAFEPYSGDSFVRWGFMNAIFEQKEYFEGYVMEKIAAEMLKITPGLQEQFEKKLKEDEAFRKSPDKRLNYFYQLSPYSDKKQNVYPVLRIEDAI